MGPVFGQRGFTMPGYEKMKTLSKLSVMIVDDSRNARVTLSDILSAEGYSVRCAGTVAEAREELKKRSYAALLVDLKLPDGTGLDLLKEIKSGHRDAEVIILTGYASLDSSISAINAGAFSYLKKPVNIDELKTVMARVTRDRRLEIENRALMRKMKALSLKDSHTGLYNHRYLMERLAKEIVRAKRYSAPLSLLMADIDYFKSINDVYGHRYGDLILKKLGRFLLDTVRENDVVVRFGGEEFVIIMPDTDRGEAELAAQRILQALRKRVFDPRKRKISIKLSVGLADLSGSAAGNAAELIDMADKAMRNAKRSGGDRLSLSGSGGEEEIENIIKTQKKDKVLKIREKVTNMSERARGVAVESINALAKTIEARDHYAGEHAKAMASMVSELGKNMKLPPEKIKQLEHAAVLHDLGKLGVSDSILSKKGSLTKGEYEKIKKHPQIGADLVKAAKCLDEVVTMVLHHHERFDGKGYPSGLKGKDIPLGARIVAVADVYQALMTDRPYRKAYAREEATDIVVRGSGTQFDPKVIKMFTKAIRSRKI
jgi:diguanylate cyclase (GGDEF)-like protein